MFTWLYLASNMVAKIKPLWDGLNGKKLTYLAGILLSIATYFYGKAELAGSNAEKLRGAQTDIVELQSTVRQDHDKMHEMSLRYEYVKTDLDTIKALLRRIPQLRGN